MAEKPIREIFYYKDYYLSFFETLKPDVQRKFNWTIQLISRIDRIPEKYFKHITDSKDLYEIELNLVQTSIPYFAFSTVVDS